MSVVPFFTLEHVPVECNVLWDTPVEAQSVSRGTLALSFCPACGHIYNTRFDPNLAGYHSNYENSLHYSPRFQAYAEELASSLVQRHGLYKKRIVEIGSGKGDFLNLLCEKGENQGEAFDPSYDGAASPFKRIRFHQEYLDVQSLSGNVDFICSRHTLEHTSKPRLFVDALRLASLKSGAAVFIEVPNALHTLRELAVWDLIYEHVSYFSPSSLASLFTGAGFDVCRLETTYEGQFLTLEAVPSPGQTGRIRTGQNILSAGSLWLEAQDFSRRYMQKAQLWRVKLADLRESHARAVLWGAGSKGISFLNMMAVTGEIACVVDINPRKHGRFISGSGHEIVPPEYLKGYRPERVILMNAIYLKEVEAALDRMNLSPEIWTA